MGCSASSDDAAFRHNVNCMSIEEWRKTIGDTRNACVLEVALEVVLDVNEIDGMFNKTNPYVEFKISPKDSIAGEQKQISSAKPDTLRPKWEPAEKFRFALSNLDPVKSETCLIVNVNQYSKANKKNVPVCLGEARIKLIDIINGLTEVPKEHTFQLSIPSTGRKKGKIQLMIGKDLSDDSLNVRNTVAYQYERYIPFVGWGNEGNHLLPTDPGGWLSEDGKRFGNTLQQVTPKVPVGWVVTQSWCVMATDDDPDGWTYSSNFYSPLWYPTKSQTTVIRRRPWSREIRKENTFAEDEKGHMIFKHDNSGNTNDPMSVGNSTSASTSSSLSRNSRGGVGGGWGAAAAAAAKGGGLGVNRRGSTGGVGGRRSTVPNMSTFDGRSTGGDGANNYNNNYNDNNNKQNKARRVSSYDRI